MVLGTEVFKFSGSLMEKAFDYALFSWVRGLLNSDFESIHV